VRSIFPGVIIPAKFCTDGGVVFGFISKTFMLPEYPGILEISLGVKETGGGGGIEGANAPLIADTTFSLNVVGFGFAAVSLAV
jgi:hypothetical protein